ncbi:MAG: lamin tail domain-containing protein, partial [Oscillospiraceae bacterium]|nr:lamin tail domain-containing protein [Oscillospiraceae bacterium]
MGKRFMSMLLAAAMLAAFIPGPPALAESDDLIEDLITIEPYGSFPGAWIDAAKLEADEEYKIVYNITAGANSNGGFRVRYISAMDGGDHNDTYNSAHSSANAQAIGFTANQIPALFENGTVEPGAIANLTVNFTLGEDIPDLSPLYMDYIGIYGMSGAADYAVNSVTVYNSADEVIGYARNEYNSLDPNDWDIEYGVPDNQKGWNLGSYGAMKAVQVVTLVFGPDTTIEAGQEIGFINNAHGGWSTGTYRITDEDVAASQVTVDLLQLAAYKWADIPESGSEYYFGIQYWGANAYAGLDLISITWIPSSWVPPSSLTFPVWLPVGFHGTSGSDWYSEGYNDGATTYNDTGLSMEALNKAKYLVLEVEDADGTASPTLSWDGYDSDETYNGNYTGMADGPNAGAINPRNPDDNRYRFVYDLSELEDYDELLECDAVKLTVGALAGLELERAYLTDSPPILYGIYDLDPAFDNVVPPATPATQGKWDGTSIDVLRGARYLVLEMTNAPTEFMYLYWGGNALALGSNIVTFSAGSTATRKIIKFPDLISNYSALMSDEGGWIGLGYPGSLASLGITRAYLSSDVPGAPELPEYDPGDAEPADSVIINQVFGSGPLDNTGAISHSFVELYNPTDTAADLDGFSLQIQNGVSASDPAGTDWVKFDFNSTHYIMPKSSFLIRLQQAATTNARYVIPNADVDWAPAGFIMSNRAFSVALVANQDLLSKEIDEGELDDVVDLVGGFNPSPPDMPINYRVVPAS